MNRKQIEKTIIDVIELKDRIINRATQKLFAHGVSEPKCDWEHILYDNIDFDYVISKDEPHDEPGATVIFRNQHCSPETLYT